MISDPKEPEAWSVEDRTFFCPPEYSQLNKLIWQQNPGLPEYKLLLFQATVSASHRASNIFSRLIMNPLVSTRHDCKHLTCQIPMRSSQEYMLLLFQETISASEGAGNISRLIVSIKHDSKHLACQIPMHSSHGLMTQQESLSPYW